MDQETPSRNRVLVCDDEKNMRRVLADVLEEDGWEVACVASGEEVIEHIGGRGEKYDAIILDLSLPGMNGLAVIEKLREAGNDSGIVVITAYGSVDAAVRAMQSGAVDFLIKPFDNSRIKAVLRKIRESRGLLDNLERSHPTLVGADNLPLNIVGADPRLTDILRVIKQIASLKTSVLVHGESGTGKELVAQAIHFNGSRRHMPYVALNCAALPETLLESEFFGHERGAFTGAHALVRGKFELAHHGTLFLDEVGDMSLALQVKLLRVLQEGEFTRVGESTTRRADARVIAATNRPLEKMIEEGAFRRDLYYRLNVVPLVLPPLRERPEDIVELVEHFARRFSPASPVRFSPETLDALRSYPWPGNIRELENAVEHAIVLGEPDGIVLGDLPAAIQDFAKGGGLPEESTPSAASGMVGQASLEEIEKACLLQALDKTRGNRTRAARILNITRRTLGYRLRKYGLEEEVNDRFGRENPD